MHVSTDFRGVLQMTLNVLRRFAETTPTAGDVAEEIERAGGNMIEVVAELEAELLELRKNYGPFMDNRRGRKAFRDGLSLGEIAGENAAVGWKRAKEKYDREKRLWAVLNRFRNESLPTGEPAESMHLGRLQVIDEVLAVLGEDHDDR